MITLKEKQTNTITYQKETDTPLVTSSYEDGYGYNIVIYPTLENDTSIASIAFTTSSTEENPRWETLSFDISTSTNYTDATIKGLPGTTYNLEVWYGPEFTGSGLIWGTTSTTFGETSTIWSFGGVEQGVTYNEITSVSTKRFEDRVFISGSVSPIEKKYISSNEQAVYTVYQG